MVPCSTSGTLGQLMLDVDGQFNLELSHLSMKIQKIIIWYRPRYLHQWQN
jgi:VCBS repeat-containing protein